MRRALAAAALACGCTGVTGTISIGLTMAPGSSVLDPATSLRVTLTDPPQAFAVQRQGAGFDLAFDLDASAATGSIVIEALDANGALVATGQSPPFPFAAINANVVIYMAAPMSIAAAPIALTPARRAVAAAALPYGVVFAGGRDLADAPSDALAVYNAYDHSLTAGVSMPVSRSGIVIAVDTTGGVYLYGGVGADGNPAPSLIRFDTTIAPNGSYTLLGDQPGLARSGELAVRTASDRFLITGTPPAELVAGTLAARTELASLPSIGASVMPGDGLRTALFVGGTTGLVRFRSDSFDTLAGDPRMRAGIAALPGGKFVVIGGGDATTPARSALVVDAETGAVTEIADGLSEGRYDPAIAATARHLVVAGGVDASGTPIATADILDATTLAPIATIPLTPRVGASAFALPNDQVLIAGGLDATDLIELFTPPPPTASAAR